MVVEEEEEVMLSTEVMIMGMSNVLSILYLLDLVPMLVGYNGSNILRLLDLVMDVHMLVRYNCTCL